MESCAVSEETFKEAQVCFRCLKALNWGKSSSREGQVSAEHTNSLVEGIE